MNVTPAQRAALAMKQARAAYVTKRAAELAVSEPARTLEEHTARLNDINRPNYGKPLADVRALAYGGIAQYAEEPRKTESIVHTGHVIELIEREGWCLWHACALVAGAPCSCAGCRGTKRRSIKDVLQAFPLGTPAREAGDKL